MPESPLIDRFAEIEDPRHPRNPLYPMEEILLLAGTNNSNDVTMRTSTFRK
jgi:hypothetical protein